MPEFAVSLSLTKSCQANGGQLVASLSGGDPAAAYDCFLYRTDYFVSGAADGAGRAWTFSAVPNAADYTVEVSVAGSSGGSPGDGTIVASQTVSVACNVTDPEVPADPLALVSKVETAATVTDPARGRLNLTVSGGVAPRTASIPGLAAVVLDAGGSGQLSPLVGSGTATVTDSSTPPKTLAVPYTITAFVPPPPPPPEEPTQWHAVGGLLPRPAALPTPVSSLITATNAARLGLHVEVELRREEQELPFARVRKTVRQLDEVVDVATLLHAELRPEMGYPTGIVTPDPAASVAFRYRYREVDTAATGDWVEGAALHRAVLCALPIGPLDENLPALHVASSNDPAYGLTTFPSGQAVQWVGLPLDVVVWLPDGREADLFAEFVYRDALGAELEIKTRRVRAALPAGVARIPLPGSPLPCAATVTFVLSDTDRAYAGSCPEQPPQTTGIFDKSFGPQFN